MNFNLTACEHTSYERTSGGPTVYLDELSDAAKIAARQQIVQSLTRGGGAYVLGLGDEVEIFFHLERRATARPYVISTADKLRIEFLGDTDSQIVQVRPDGRISLPQIGPVMAAGQTAADLARRGGYQYARVCHRSFLPKWTPSDVTDGHFLSMWWYVTVVNILVGVGS